MRAVLDADSAIKLAKAEVLPLLPAWAQCFMSKQAYDEVLKGKEKMYEDAFIIEALQQQGQIKIEEVKTEAKVGLGIGEWSSLILFRKINADVIISDDRKFLSLLETELTPFMTSTDSIVMLALLDYCTKSEARRALEKIRLLVREENYCNAKEKLGGK